MGNSSAGLSGNGLAAARDVLLVAPPQGRRTQAFQDTLRGLGWPPARVVPYLDLMEDRAHLPELIRAGRNGEPETVLRFDSPGEDVATELALIGRGGGQAVDLAAGELAPAPAWFAGFSTLIPGLGSV